MDVPALSPSTEFALKAHVRDHFETPEQYIVRLFGSKDLVLLAEDHAVLQNLTLVHKLIPLLHVAGVYHLGMEFGAAEDQELVDQLVTAQEYDEQLARDIMFNYNSGWAYREYMEIYRVVWKLNRSLGPHDRRFRIVQLSYRFNWEDAPIVRTPANAAKIFNKGPVDRFRAQIVGKEVLEQGEKMLILTGTVHGFTRYRLPVYDGNVEGFVRFDTGHLGQILYQRYPGRLACVLLHQPFPSLWEGFSTLVLAGRGAIDQVLGEMGVVQIGFDLKNTPFGDLADDSFYSTAYENFTLSDLADGYIYLGPISTYEGCSVDEKFLNSANWPQARRQFADPNWHQVPDTLDEMWAKIRGYRDLAQRYGSLYSRNIKTRGP